VTTPSRSSGASRASSTSGAGLTAVGAWREATLGYVDPEELAYLDIRVTEQAEVLTFVGDIAV
jgi:hypothetical protein